VITVLVEQIDQETNRLRLINKREYKSRIRKAKDCDLSHHISNREQCSQHAILVAQIESPPRGATRIGDGLFQIRKQQQRSSQLKFLAENLPAQLQTNL